MSAPPPAEGPPVDAIPLVLKEGMVLLKEDLMILRQLIPSELWRHREVFFHEGMRMVVGGCHRRYPTAGFYRRATEKFAGQSKLDDDQNLLGHTAGLPFPPDGIDAEDEDAALRWAWNVQYRYRGAGPRGKFRVVDFPSSLGSVQTYEGTFFLIQASERADLAEQNYEIAEKGDDLWIWGGEFDEPFDTRGLAWRQYRPDKSRRRYNQPDDIFVYVPTMRKMRRAAATWVDGLYSPRYAVSGDAGGGGLVFGDPVSGTGGAINPTAGLSAAVSESTRRGFEGMALRPNAYIWRYHGSRTVLAPLNGSRPGYPIEDERNFGTSGLSVASDRWDIRFAVVIEGALKREGQDVRTLTIYVDYQTQQPLYWITRTGRRRLLDIGVLVHRFSGDMQEYPEWPGGVPANVFEPVAASFYNALAGGGGWRRESYDAISIPYKQAELRRLTASERLDRGH
ncbi:MAG: DUF1329 domain-containing protein [Proteobacteria bacterium]|nr:DUF1329 domain-containing protein [Pseudomonadota bacterium]